MNTLKFYALLTAGAVVAIGATAPPKVIVSNVFAHPTNFIDGTNQWQASGTDPFDRFFVSSDGQTWVLTGEQENGSSDLDIIVRGTGMSSTGLAVVARENGLTGLTAGEAFITVRDDCGVRNDGTVVFSADTNASTISDELVVTWLSGTTYTKVFRESEPIPALIGSSFGNGTDSVHWANNLPRTKMTGVSGGASASVLYEGNSSAGSVISRSAFSVPGNQVNPPQTVLLYNSNRFTSAADEGTPFYVCQVNGSSTTGQMWVKGNDVIAQKGTILPGSGFSTTINLFGQVGTNNISPNGSHWIFSGSNLTDGLDWVNTGQGLVAVVDQTVTGATETWSDNSYSPCYFACDVNSFGESIVGGYTNAASATNEVLVYNSSMGKRVVARKNDGIDLNGDGLLNDSCFISTFGQDLDFNITDGCMVYFQCDLKNSAGTFIGEALIGMEVPLPGDVNGDGEVGPADFTLLSAAFGSSLGDPNYNVDADLNKDDEVGPADFTILSQNFGRSR